MMDLVTLVAACSLAVQPSVIHALVWHQSGGEPWSFSVPGESQLRIYPTIQEALREGRAAPQRAPLHVGLAGLPADAGMVTRAMFAPCPNITTASRRIGELAERCSATQSLPNDPIHCALAAYHGSWEGPDSKFADAVLASVAKGDAPNFDMPGDTYFTATDLVSKPLDSDRNGGPTTAAVVADERQLGWSSALFPARPERIKSARGSDPDASALQTGPPSTRALVTQSRAQTSSMNQLFVPRSEQRRPE